MDTVLCLVSFDIACGLMCFKQSRLDTIVFGKYGLKPLNVLTVFAGVDTDTSMW